MLHGITSTETALELSQLLKTIDDVLETTPTLMREFSEILRIGTDDRRLDQTVQQLFHNARLNYFFFLLGELGAVLDSSTSYLVVGWLRKRENEDGASYASGMEGEMISQADSCKRASYAAKDVQTWWRDIATLLRDVCERSRPEEHGITLWPFLLFSPQRPQLGLIRDLIEVTDKVVIQLTSLETAFEELQMFWRRRTQTFQSVGMATIVSQWDEPRGDNQEAIEAWQKITKLLSEVSGKVRKARMTMAHVHPSMNGLHVGKSKNTILYYPRLTKS